MTLPPVTSQTEFLAGWKQRRTKLDGRDMSITEAEASVGARADFMVFYTREVAGTVALFREPMWAMDATHAVQKLANTFRVARIAATILEAVAIPDAGLDTVGE
jgi:hypothetical protein